MVLGSGPDVMGKRQKTEMSIVRKWVECFETLESQEDKVKGHKSGSIFMHKRAFTC